MEGRFPNGILFVMSNCSDPSKEDEFNDWYTNIHLPDVTATGIFKNATRYMNPTAKGTADDPKYLAVYETDREDAAAARAEHTADRGHYRPLHPALSVVVSGTFQRSGSLPKPPTDKPTVGVLASLSDCNDPAKEAEYTKWMEEFHVADVLATPLYWGAMRFVNTSPEGGHPKFLVIYETERDGPSTYQDLVGWPTRDGSRGDGIKFRAVRISKPFNLIYSQVGSRVS